MSETPSTMNIGADIIRKWHTDPKPNGRGWSDIGYHYVIKRDGTIEKGRDLDVIGAHTLGENSHSIGICYVGGMGGDNRTDIQKEVLHKLVQSLIIVFGNMSVHGHNEFSDKECPNFNVSEEFEYINIGL